MNGWARAGACCSRTPPTSRRCAPPNWAPSRGCTTSSQARDTKVAAVSVDPAESHRAWAADIAETQGAEVNFPLIADPDRRVATLYGMIHPRHDDTATVRSVFIIGPDKKVKLTLTYPASTGRHFGEILRVLDSLQLTAAHQLATPADWQPGTDVIITPAVSQRRRHAASPITA
jgi:alkyl hydroperoxide reductase subunit AhpC